MNRILVTLVALLGLYASLSQAISVDQEEFIEMADYKDLMLEPLPKSVNWTAWHAVSPVRDQGKHNISWAFAAAAVIESRQFIKTRSNLTVLSTQNILDCCHVYYKYTANVLKCIQELGGIDTEASYPFNGNVQQCRFKNQTIGAKITTLFKVAPSEKILTYTVAYGPVAATISYEAILKYKGGVLSKVNCDSLEKYTVLIAGYGTEKGQDYWLLKTSMGTKWGEGGYMKLARNKNNLCGITDRAYYPGV